MFFCGLEWNILVPFGSTLPFWTIRWVYNARFGNPLRLFGAILTFWTIRWVYNASFGNPLRLFGAILPFWTIRWVYNACFGNPLRLFGAMCLFGVGGVGVCNDGTLYYGPTNHGTKDKPQQIVAQWLLSC